MLRRLPILPLLLGGIAAVVVWFWPARPMWRSGPEAGWVQAISADGKVLVTTHEQTYCDPQMMRWDIETGELLSKAALRCEIPKSMRIARVSADGKFALVGEGKQIDKNFTLNFVTGNTHLHDGISGRRLTGPIAGAVAADWHPFSLCGRWFRAHEGEPDGGFEDLRGEAIFSTTTGDLVGRAQTKAGQQATMLFAPDGNTAAVIFRAKDRSAKDPMRAVQVIELPSGRVLREATLGPHDWVVFDDWDGSRLTARTRVNDVDNREVWRKIHFEFSQEAVGEETHEPLLNSYPDHSSGPAHTREGADWIAQITFPPRIRPERTALLDWFGKVTDWFGVTSPMRGSHAQVRILDRHTGATRYQSPRLHGTILLTPDGRRIACHAPTDDSRVEVWDADPAPRWLLPLLAGVGTTGVLSVRRWKRKDAPKKEHPSLG